MIKKALAGIALASTLLTVAPKPALADGAASTRNILLSAAAAYWLISANNEHQRARQNPGICYDRYGNRFYCNGNRYPRRQSYYYRQANRGHHYAYGHRDWDDRGRGHGDHD